MGVRKFRSIEEMSGPAARPPLEAENLRLAFGLMETACRLSASKLSPGVRRFRSYDEAKARSNR